MEESPERGPNLSGIPKMRLWAHVGQDLKPCSCLASWAPSLTLAEISRLGRDGDFPLLWYLSSLVFSALKSVFKK